MRLLVFATVGSQRRLRGVAIHAGPVLCLSRLFAPARIFQRRLKGVAARMFSEEPLAPVESMSSHALLITCMPPIGVRDDVEATKRRPLIHFDRHVPALPCGLGDVWLGRHEPPEHRILRAIDDWHFIWERAFRLGSNGRQHPAEEVAVDAMRTTCVLCLYTYTCRYEYVYEYGRA